MNRGGHTARAVTASASPGKFQLGPAAGIVSRNEGETDPAAWSRYVEASADRWRGRRRRRRRQMEPCKRSVMPRRHARSAPGRPGLTARLAHMGPLLAACLQGMLRRPGRIGYPERVAAGKEYWSTLNACALSPFWVLHEPRRGGTAFVPLDHRRAPPRRQQTRQRGRRRRDGPPVRDAGRRLPYEPTAGAGPRVALPRSRASIRGSAVPAWD